MSTGRIAMVVIALLVLFVAISNPPSIFWIMFLGGSVAASSWMPVALASVLSKRVTKTGAFLGMLFGVLGCFVTKLYSSITGVILPVYLDASVIGIVCSVVAMIMGSFCTKVTDEEIKARNALFIMPESEKNPKEMSITLKWARGSISIGLMVMAILFILWIFPYRKVA